MFTTIIALTVGAVFVMWLGEQITERGIGNGMSLLIFFSIIEIVPGRGRPDLGVLHDWARSASSRWWRCWSWWSA